MKTLRDPIVSGIVGAALSSAISLTTQFGGAGVSRFMWAFLSTFWPLLVGAVTFLIVWQIQFFRHVKKNQEAQFETWRGDQAVKIHDQFNSQFQTLAQDTKNTRPDTVADVEKLLHRWDERIKKLESREPT